jgi:quercetin dioxygenase-like cupin family protein
VLPHWHPDEPRTIVVLSGTLYFGFGEHWDEGKLEPLPPGTFFIEPANATHYAWAKDEDVILQLTSIGPSGTTPVQPPR